MKFSFVIPVYNVEKYIEKCLSSILNQSYQDFEIIIIDDSSPDRSIEIIKNKFQDPRIQIFSKPNGGLSSARNYGLPKAKGEYIWFVDSDDHLSDNDALLKIFNTIIANQYPEIVIFNNTVVFEDNKKNGWENINAPSNTKVLSGAQYIAEYKILPINAWTQCYRRDFLIENHFKFTEQMYFEDIYLNLDIYKKAKKVIGINYSLLNYLKRENSIMTGGFNLVHLNSQIKVLNKFNFFIKNNELDKDYLNNRIQYEYQFLKKIFTSAYNPNNRNFEKIDNIAIPVTKKDSIAVKLEKKLFRYFPNFTLKKTYIFDYIERIEKKVKK
ncbi:glycosyltransferase [Cruoricaptor ignavus]|uniref:Glycosyltransferase n=1 Tax=Cruoricaptor ignavus TaxID=1118202 RepID=A0A7M1T0L9_9FLAO|nr:glycosyltransferase [Cruoricaptor ignavus]QOR73380.1 glycosyltransferase [Cruoricaptor ignavus]